VAKALKIAAIVVGVAAVVLTAGAALGVIAPVIAGVATATIATVLSVASTVLSLAAGVLAKPPKLKTGTTGQQLDWSADPATGEPYVMGQAMVGASIVHQASWGDKNRYLGIVGVLSVCTISAFNGFYADMTPVSFSGRNAAGYYSNYMYVSDQLGALPEGAALDMTAPDASTMPDWGAAYKTSGLATVGLVLVADVDNGKVYSGGAPKMTNLIHGVKAYDPRFDSTAGGSGTQRATTESTYAYSENPWVHAVTYALGRWQNSVRVIGPGLPASKIDTAAFMEAAAIADSNGWKISGVISSTEAKWDALKAICQAGGGYPMPTGAHLSCLVNAPKISLDMITESDVRGAVSVPQMFTRRDRLNGAIPRVRSANHGWEIVPEDAVRNSTYLAADGGNATTKEFEYALVADEGDGAGIRQAAQLAGYEVANSRELSPISVELGYVWSQYKLGDCLTLNLPSANLVNRKCVVIGRTINVARNTITLIFRTEDDTKHTWALGLTGSVSTPPTTSQAHGIGDQNTVTPGANIAALGDSNRVRFSRFEKDTLGWAIYNPNALSVVATVSHTDTDKIEINGSFTANSQQVAIRTDAAVSGNRAFRIPVNPGERIYVGGVIGKAGAAGATWQLFGVFKADDNSTVGTPFNVNSGTATAAAPGDFTSVPGGAAYLSYELYLFNQLTGAGSFTLSLSKPIVCGAALHQVEAPAFTPGPSGEYGADVTGLIDLPSTVTIFANSSGTPKSGQLPAPVVAKYLRSGTALTSGVTWSASTTEGNATFTISGTGAADLEITGRTTARSRLRASSKSPAPVRAFSARPRSRSFGRMIRRPTLAEVAAEVEAAALQAAPLRSVIRRARVTT
jgi:hypothetical protein